MPCFDRAGASLYYELHGLEPTADSRAFPVVLFAPGGMRSSIELWSRAPWSPLRELAPDRQVIGLDQRNAGRSTAPVGASDGWETYSADHLALLDHLGIERCHLLGGCIGSSYCLALLQRAPDRIASAVLQNPIGLHENRAAFREMFDGWAAQLRPRHPDLDAAGWCEFRERMYGGDFVFSVSRDFVRACTTPLLILAGNDLYHPAPISRELAALAPRAELIEHWREPEHIPETVKRVRAFLTP
jgi:pimeloyl-ACP methyl ester carboxylesterase